MQNNTEHTVIATRRLLYEISQLVDQITIRLKTIERIHEKLGNTDFDIELSMLTDIISDTGVYHRKLHSNE